MNKLKVAVAILAASAVSASANVCDERPADLLPKGANNYELVDVEVLTMNGGRVDWGNDGNLYFDRQGDDLPDGRVVHEVWSMDMTTRVETCITCGNAQLYADAGPARGMPSKAPNSNLLAFQAEHPNHKPVFDPNAVGPAKGLYNDLWVMNLDTGVATLLNRVSNGKWFQPKGGTLHPQWNHAGDQIMWADMEDFGVFGALFGVWHMSLANVAVVGPAPGTPILYNTQMFTPGQGAWFETHSWGPNDSIFVYTSDSVNQTVLSSDINYNSVEQLEAGCDSIRLTETSGLFNEEFDFDEHAHYAPNGDAIMWLTDPAPSNKGELWIMNPDGSDKRQVTQFNVPGSVEYILTGGDYNLNVPSDNSWNPNADPGQAQLAVYVQVDFALFANEPGIPFIYLLTFNTVDVVE